MSPLFSPFPEFYQFGLLISFFSSFSPFFTWHVLMSIGLCLTPRATGKSFPQVEGPEEINGLCIYEHMLRGAISNRLANF